MKPKTERVLFRIVDALASHDADTDRGTNVCDRVKLIRAVERLATMLSNGDPIPSMRAVLIEIQPEPPTDKTSTIRTVAITVPTFNVVVTGNNGPAPSVAVIMASKCESLATTFVVKPDDADGFAVALVEAAQHARTKGG